jgi:hypothetical protein
MMRHKLIAIVALGTFAAAASADRAAQIILINGNAANVGLNDPTPVAPVGGNPMTTLGGQRMYALQHAAGIIAPQLQSQIPIQILVSFGTRTCNATGAVLASAGARWVDMNFKRAIFPDTWYHGALVNALAKTDLGGGDPSSQAIFNINLGQSNCLAGSPFYYGLDGNEGNGVDLVATALHEFSHGLGFSQFASVTTGALFLGSPDAYNRNLLDTTLGATWDVMTNAERQASAVNFNNVVWIGTNVTQAVPGTLALGLPVLNILAPASLAGPYAVGTAAFGPPLADPGITGQIAVATDAADGAGPSTTDACSAITNAATVAGKIALVDRGTCGFIVKVKNAQVAGAIAVLVADNVAGGPPAGLGGVDPTITIPSVRITLADGNAIKAALATDPVSGTLGLDMTRLAGANPDGLALLNAPNPVVPGSSISHWDPIARPNLLEEPAINVDLGHGLDLNLPLFKDIGWNYENTQ